MWCLHAGKRKSTYKASKIQITSMKNEKRKYLWNWAKDQQSKQTILYLPICFDLKQDYGTYWQNQVNPLQVFILVLEIGKVFITFYFEFYYVTIIIIIIIIIIAIIIIAIIFVEVNI